MSETTEAKQGRLQKEHDMLTKRLQEVDLELDAIKPDTTKLFVQRPPEMPADRVENDWPNWDSEPLPKNWWMSLTSIGIAAMVLSGLGWIIMKIFGS